MSVTDSTAVTTPAPRSGSLTGAQFSERATAITERELAIYAERTRGSQVATERARKVLPAGVPSSFQAYDPHPIVVKHASGSRMIDVDDNEYVDYDMGFGALFAGHMHPAVRRAVEAQLDDGTPLRHALRARRRRGGAARRALRHADVAADQLRVRKRRWTRSAWRGA